MNKNRAGVKKDITEKRDKCVAARRCDLGTFVCDMGNVLDFILTQRDFYN